MSAIENIEDGQEWDRIEAENKALRARVAGLDVQNGQLAGYLSTSEDRCRRYREALERIADYEPPSGASILDYARHLYDTAREALR